MKGAASNLNDAASRYLFITDSADKYGIIKLFRSIHPIVNLYLLSDNFFLLVCRTEGCIASSLAACALLIRL